ncbi:hypothetical protein TRVA0_020S01838 [Trichomonascus vanleenenianus]|uniref:uncharacterized protein n=1 Tax=Trichomonascus vanleenenianus TaxID=2268995 RepID=UPI003ECA34F0
MFWSRETPTYTPEDAEEIARGHLDDISRALGEKIYATKDGLLTETRIKCIIEQAVNGPGQTSIGLLSTKIGLPKSDIESALAEIKGRFYLQGETVICAGEVTRLEDELIKEIEQERYAIDLTLYNALNINASFLEWLVDRLKRKGEDIVNEHGLIIRQSDLSKFEKNIVESLNSSSKPTRVDSLNSDIPRGVLNHLSRNLQWLRNHDDLKGSVRNGVFTPDQYVSDQLTELIGRLDSVGYIKLGEFSTLGMKQSVESVVPGGAKVLSTLVFTQAYIDSLREECISKLDEQGYFEMSKSIHVEGITGHDWIQLKELVLEGISGIKKLADGETITKPSKQTATIEKAKDYFIAGIQKTVEEALSSPSNPDLYLNCANAYFNGEDATSVLLSQPAARRLNSVTTTSVVQYFTSSLRLPKPVVSDLIPKAMPVIEPTVQSTLARVLKEQILDITRHRVAKLQVYTSGLELVATDTKLHQKLESELKDYAATYLPETNAEEDLSSNLFQPTSSKDECIEKTYGEMLSALRAQLAQTTDMALTLHLAVLISLAKSNPPAILRASGKHVPKLLKLHSELLPPEFTELKDAIVGKSSLDQPQLAALLDFVRNYK